MSGYKHGIDRRQLEMSSPEDKVDKNCMARVIDRFIEKVLGFGIMAGLQKHFRSFFAFADVFDAHFHAC